MPNLFLSLSLKDLQRLSGNSTGARWLHCDACARKKTNVAADESLTSAGRATQKHIFIIHVAQICKRVRMNNDLHVPEDGLLSPNLFVPLVSDVHRGAGARRGSRSLDCASAVRRPGTRPFEGRICRERQPERLALAPLPTHVTIQFMHTLALSTTAPPTRLRAQTRSRRPFTLLTPFCHPLPSL